MILFCRERRIPLQLCIHWVRNSHYRTLGIAQNATQSEIKRIFYFLSLKFHPDRNPSCSNETKAKFLEINKAYQVLRDPTLRREYDKQISGGIADNHGSWSGNAQSPSENGTNMSYGFSASQQWPGTSDSSYESQFASRENQKAKNKWSNHQVLFAVCGIAILGATLQILRSIYIAERVKRVHDNRDIEARMNLSVARKRAAENGFARQVNILEAKMEELEGKPKDLKKPTKTK